MGPIPPLPVSSIFSTPFTKERRRWGLVGVWAPPAADWDLVKGAGEGKAGREDCVIKHNL